MKLFKSLLVAPAMLGFLAPLAANATEVNLNDISNYSSIDEEMEFNSKTFDKQCLKYPLENLKELAFLLLSVSAIFSSNGDIYLYLFVNGINQNLIRQEKFVF